MINRYERMLLPCILFALVAIPGLAISFFMSGAALQLWRPLLFVLVGGWLLRDPLARVLATPANRIKLGVLAGVFAPIAWLANLPGKNSDFFAGIFFYLMLPCLIVCGILVYRMAAATLAGPGRP